MEDPNSDDRLPPGWTVEVRVRKNGKKDKYYFSSSCGLKFNSKVEVFRYLDNAQNKVSIQRISNNVVVEKGIAEGLPPGWMKKTRVTTKGDTIRRDSYYIDPISGYAFRSLKAVDLYLESGKIGRNAFKPKDKDNSDMELTADKFSSVGLTTKPTLSVSMGQSSDLDMITNDQQIQKPAYSGEYMSMPISEHISTRGMVSSELTSSALLQAEASDRKEWKIGLAESTIVPGCTDEVAQENQLQDNALTKHESGEAQNRQCKRHKKEINLPRRASKRLAGIQVDPLPELKTKNRARRVANKQSSEGRVANKQSSEGETIADEDKSPNHSANAATKQINALEGGSATKTVESPKSGESKHFYGKLSAPQKLPDKTVEEHGSDKDQEGFSFWPGKSHANGKELVELLENGDKIDAKLDYSLDFPLGELLTDPCIAFAIQTLTGATFETSKHSQISSEYKSCKHSETSAAAEGYVKKIKGSNMAKEECNVFSSAENFANPQAHAGDAGVNDKGNENTGSSSEKTLDISWMDPCIEFAIKTLTGTIPLDSDQNPKNCLQQQLSSSNTQQGEVALSDNLCQTDYYCSQYFGTQKPMFKQSFVDPALQHTRNVDIGNSAGARLPHCGEDRRNVC